MRRRAYPELGRGINLPQQSAGFMPSEQKFNSSASPRSGEECLAPFLAALDKADRGAFLDRCRAKLRRAYPALPDGRILMRSRRLFVLAQP